MTVHSVEKSDPVNIKQEPTPSTLALGVEGGGGYNITSKFHCSNGVFLDPAIKAFGQHTRGYFIVIFRILDYSSSWFDGSLNCIRI